MFYVYAIKSVKSQRVYIGQTSNLDDRIKRHNSGDVKSTRKDVPWILVAFEKFQTRAQAMRQEKGLKKSRGKRIKWLERNYLVSSNEPTPRREDRKGNSNQQPEI